MAQLPLEEKISRVTDIVEKIISKDDDTVALEYYNMLKLCFDDKELCPHLAKIGKSEVQTLTIDGNRLYARVQ